ncbi:unnamed protein product [Colias eurytheme]|nr:unnamed protein product [Colias eurytheme]
MPSGKIDPPGEGAGGGAAFIHNVLSIPLIFAEGYQYCDPGFNKSLAIENRLRLSPPHCPAAAPLRGKGLM